MTDKEPHSWQTESALWRKLKARTREFRVHPTRAEAVLWKELRNAKVHGTRFRRQHAVGPFVLDFYSWKANLAIEVDGPIHESSRDQDIARSQYLLSRGIRVLRFSNDEIEHSMPSVLNRIDEALSSPSPSGEGVGG